MPRSSSLVLSLLLIVAWCAILASAVDYSFDNTTCSYCSRSNQITVGSGKVPHTNGCGPAGFSGLVPEYRFHNCCDWHDACYGTCGQVKENCDSGLFVCMLQACDEDYENDSSSLSRCRDIANCYASSVTTVTAVSCEAFKASQEEVTCVCVDDSDGNWTLPPPIETEYQNMNVMPSCDVEALMKSYITSNAHRGMPWSGVAGMVMMIVVVLVAMA